MTLKNCFPLFVILLLVSASCKKSSVNAHVPPNTDTIPAAQWQAGTDVYFVGMRNGAATIWDNGVPTAINFPSGYSGNINSVAVNGMDVYVVGAQNGQLACYWKNGVFAPLSNGASNAYAISVSNNDVYISGFAPDSIGAHTACYWKNGAVKFMPEYSNNSTSEANGITVSGSDVYLAGFINDYHAGALIACYWKNGVLTKISSNTVSSAAFGAAVMGSDVYVVGYEYGKGATLWKNGVASVLPGATGNSAATAIKVSGQDIYVAGLVDGKAVYWKDGVENVLKGVPANVNFVDIALSGTDVYVASGYVDDSATTSIFWKNGTAASFDKARDVITGVYVVQH
jgi:hypothetical protein